MTHGPRTKHLHQRIVVELGFKKCSNENFLFEFRHEI